MPAEEELYYKIFDTMLVLRDVHLRFQPYSPHDIKTLINSKLNAKKHDPVALTHLYKLETMISELRTMFIAAKEAKEADVINVMVEED